MKKIALLVCLCLTCAQLRADEPPKFASFIEGFIAGLVIGTATGVIIIIGVRQIRQRPHSDYSDSRPAWTYPPPVPPQTNAPVGTNFTKLVIDAGDAMPFYDVSSLQLPDVNGGGIYTNGFVTALQESTDLLNWTTIYRFYGWQSVAGQVAVAASADWQPIATNYCYGSFSYLELPLARGENRFYRCVRLIEAE